MPEISLYVTNKQAEIIDHGATMKIVTCGRRWGKTFSALSYLVKSALLNPLAESSYVGKTYKLAYKMFRKISCNAGVRRFIKTQKQQPSPHIEWTNGHVTWFFSGDRPDNLRGDGLTLCIADEAAHMPERLITEVLMPTMLDHGGTLVLMSTFRGRNWYYDWHTKGTTYPNADDVCAWLNPTSSAVWAQTDRGRRDLRRMQSRLPDTVWQQECECVVDANQAATFRDADIGRCTRGAPRTPRAGFGYVLAYDSGKATDPGAIIILECSASVDKCAVVYAEELPLGMPYNEQVDKVVRLARQYQACVSVDSTGAGTKDAIVDFLKKAAPELAVYGVQLRGDIPQNMVRAGAWYFEKDFVDIPAAFGSLIYELRQFEYSHTQNGKYRYHAPEGEHDDLVWAFLMAVDAKKKRLFRVPASVVPKPAPGSQGDVFYQARHAQQDHAVRL